MRGPAKTRHGYSLVELMVVVAIVGILVSLAVPNFISWNRKYQLKSDVANLAGTMGFASGPEEGGVLRLQSSDSGVGSVVNLRRAEGFWRGAGGVGTVHHVAFRAATDEAQLTKRAEIEAQGLGITPVIDRQYFRSVYFREPGGVLFEIATMGPGFMVDEAPASLGEELKLPPWEEPHRRAIEAGLAPVVRPCERR